MIQNLTHRMRNFPGAHLGQGLPTAEIEAIELAVNIRLPIALRTFYQTCDGARFDDGGFELLSIKKADALRQSLIEMRLDRSWQYWPLTENNDSNPICICCSGLLSGYVVQVYHDRSPMIKWSSLETFLAATLDYIANDEWSLEFMPNEFASANRSAKDIEVARSLLRETATKPIEDSERGDMCRFACWLFGEQQWAEVAGLLRTEDEYVRRDVKERLKAIPHPDAQRALRSDEDEFLAFVHKCAQQLTNAGFRTEVDQHSQLQVLDGPIWLNMKMFFSERRRPDFDGFLVERAKHLVTLKHLRTS